jgi:hypothetical protein
MKNSTMHRLGRALPIWPTSRCLPCGPSSFFCLHRALTAIDRAHQSVSCSPRAPTLSKHADTRDPNDSPSLLRATRPGLLCCVTCARGQDVRSVDNDLAVTNARACRGRRGDHPGFLPGSADHKPTHLISAI